MMIMNKLCLNQMSEVKTGGSCHVNCGNAPVVYFLRCSRHIQPIKVEVEDERYFNMTVLKGTQANDSNWSENVKTFLFTGLARLFY